MYRLRLSHNIYSSPNPVTSIANATKVGSVFEPEWTGKRLTLAKPDARWKIPDGNGGTYELAADEGLFVYTPHDTATVYFYVNKNNEMQLSATNRTAQRLFVRYNPATEPVKCHEQFSGVTAQGFPYTVFSVWVDGRNDPDDARPDFPVMANGEKTVRRTFLQCLIRRMVSPPDRSPPWYVFTVVGNRVVTGLMHRIQAITATPEMCL
jgi:hypothetical protein